MRTHFGWCHLMYISQLFERIPDHLSERVRVLSSHPVTSSGFVLYWMRTAERGHENPALDAAIEFANLLSLPVFVYHGLSERYPYASDRHHRFILEGAIDVQIELKQRNIGYGFHLERPSHRGPMLKRLASMSTLVITEDMPTDPMRRWTNQLITSVPVSVCAVDTACIVPMARCDRYYTRAYSYRNGTARMRESRVRQEWIEAIPEKPHFIPTLPFTHVKVSKDNIQHLISQCEIDHSIAPVFNTIGGATSGYRRWNTFKSTELNKYHRTRNDPNLLSTSRLSAYLHYGQISPFKIAREASKEEGKGADKFLDELLIWRELAYLWCDRHHSLDSWEHVPDWAQQSLEAESDRIRTPLYGYETLFRGKTLTPFWNACQRSLLIHGELHNALRMTWAKMMIPWTKTPQEAHRWMIDLNHRLALDGRDPASYGGILWSLGLFDSPKKVSKPYFGVVRSRDEGAHIRFNLERFTNHVDRPRHNLTPTIAIIGAGMAGLTCGRTLIDHGLNVCIFDKGYRPGGRISTRQSRTILGWEFDHGAPAFQCRDKRFLLRVKSWEQLGIVKEWDGPFGFISSQGDFIGEEVKQTRYVGVPQMSSLTEHLAKDLNITSSCRITKIVKEMGRWTLYSDDTNMGMFDELVIAIPKAQLQELLPKRFSQNWMRDIPEARCCFTVMLQLETPISIPWAMVKSEYPQITKIIQEKTKPERKDTSNWTIHSYGEWAQNKIQHNLQAIQNEMLNAFSLITKANPQIKSAQIHRWKYALTGPQEHSRHEYREKEEGLSVCADWLKGPTVESAYLSGSHVAGVLLGELRLQDQ